jgi:hypothetical protein
MKITQRSFVLVAAAATAALLSACSSTAAPAPSPTVTVTSTATVTAPAVTVTATVTATAASSKAGYDAAVTEWKAGALADSADQGKNWSKAVTDLTNGESTDSDSTGYATAVGQLTQLISLPDAQQTTAQNASYHADINALNTFFATPGLYS